MKKCIAYTLILVLLSSMVFSVQLSAGADDNGKGNNFFFDLTTQEGVTAAVNGQNDISNFMGIRLRNAATGTLTYDDEQEAMKVTLTDPSADLNLFVDIFVGKGANGHATEGANPNAVTDESKWSEDYNEYPVMALKVKRANADVQLGNAGYFYNYGSNWRGIWPVTGHPDYQGAGKTFSAYADTDDWQLLIYDTTAGQYGDDGHFDSTHFPEDTRWKKFGLQMALNDTELTEGAVAYIQWAGVFTSAEAAQKEFARETEKKDDIPEEWEAVEKANNFFFDFTTEDSCTKNIDSNVLLTVNSQSDVTFGFEETEQAMKVALNKEGSTSQADIIMRRSNSSGNESFVTYPVFAVKIKRAYADVEMGSVYYSREFGSNWYNLWPGSNDTTKEKTFSTYKDTDDWQLMIFNPTTADNHYGQAHYMCHGTTDDTTHVYNSAACDFYTGTQTHGCNAQLKGFRLCLAQNSADLAAGDVAYIAWAGAFASEEDAQTYFAQTTPIESEENLFCTQAAILAEQDENNNQGLRFYQNLITKVDENGIEKITHNGEELAVTNIFVLMATAKTVKANGGELTRDIVDDKKVLQTEVKTCRSRVFDEETRTATYCFTALLKNIPQKQRGTFISARAYLECVDSNGNTRYVYGNEQITSVREMFSVVGASYFDEKVSDWMANVNTGFFVDFNSASSLEHLTVTDNTTKSYWSTQEETAALIAPSDDGIAQGGTIQVSPSADLDVSQYPVFAMRVKLKNPDSQFGRFYWRTTDYITAYNAVNDLIKDHSIDTEKMHMNWWPHISGEDTTITYKNTTDWQIVYVDFTDVRNPYFSGNWVGAMLNLLPISGEGVTTDDGVYIDWMGAFESPEDAYAHARVDWDGEYYVDLDVTLTQAEKEAKEAALLVNNDLGSITNLGSLESEFQLISDFDSEQTFKHHPSLVYYDPDETDDEKGLFYASFSSGEKDEDAPGQKMVYCTSKDFIHWSDPITIVDTKQSTNYPAAQTSIIGGFYVQNNTLCYSYTETDYKAENFDENGVFNKTGSEGSDRTMWTITWDKDSETWSAPVKISSTKAYGQIAQSPVTNRWFSIFGFFMHYSDDGVNWNWSMPSEKQILDSRARCPGTLTETSWYQSKDEVVHLVIRSETGYLWQCESRDNGLTWSAAYPTNFASASTMFKFVHLPDGRVAWIGSPFYDMRWPLCIYISEDGYNFDKGYVLRHELYTMQDDNGYAKGGTFAYPSAIVVDNYLYVLYSKQKEVIEISRVDLDKIP